MCAFGILADMRPLKMNAENAWVCFASRAHGGDSGLYNFGCIGDAGWQQTCGATLVMRGGDGEQPLGCRGIVQKNIPAAIHLTIDKGGGKDLSRAGMLGIIIGDHMIGDDINHMSFANQKSLFFNKSFPREKNGIS